MVIIMNILVNMAKHKVISIGLFFLMLNIGSISVAQDMPRRTPGLGKQA